MTDRGSLLLTNQFLGVDDYLSSTNGAFRAYMQNDGNFVVYNMLSSGQPDSRWASNIAPGVGPQYRVVMQPDGNLVVYEGPPEALSPIWASDTASGVGPQYTLNMQDDGNLVVYRSGLGDAIWSTEEIPPELSVSLVFEALGKGYQIYSCKQKSGTDPTQFEWGVKPQANLYDISGSGKIVAIHYADPITGNPIWEAFDGSKVAGKKVAEVQMDKNDVKWLLLSAVSHEGEGIFSKVVAIQRAYTKGGVHQTGTGQCDPKTDQQDVPVQYSAHYFFYGPPPPKS
jgi:Protein of unknown function (DUF3455)